MPVLLDLLCKYFKCSPDELNKNIYENGFKDTIDFTIYTHIFTSDYAPNYLEILCYSSQPANELIMDESGENKETVADYFLRRYGVQLKYPGLLCAWAPEDENGHYNERGRFIPVELINSRPYEDIKHLFD